MTTILLGLTLVAIFLVLDALAFHLATSRLGANASWWDMLPGGGFYRLWVVRRR